MRHDFHQSPSNQGNNGLFFPEDYGPYQALFLPNVEIYNAGKTLFERIKNELSDL